MRILVIDDEPGVRRAIARVLESGGHTTIWAGNAEDALLAMRREKPDAITLDLDLGKGMRDGMSILAEKLLDPTIRKIPVIVLTAMPLADIEARRTADRLAGAQIIMSKDFAIDDLLGAIAHLEDA